jgi:hypothetical protein
MRAIRTSRVCLGLSLWRGKATIVGMALLGVAFAGALAAVADPIKASVEAKVEDGYARLVFTMSDDVDANVRIAGSILIISFKQPTDISVDRLAVQAPDYIAAARRDPDGMAVRLALVRKITVNSLAVAERLFVDLLPDTWTGASPGLPQDVVADLVRRLDKAERLVRLEHLDTKPKTLAPVRVHVASQPTFTRYVFDIPELTSVSADRAAGRLTLTFDAPFKFDLGDVEATLPRSVTAISSKHEDTSASVEFNFLNNVDVRTFRGDGGYVVDLVGADDKPGEGAEAPADKNATLQTPPPAKPLSTAAPGDIESAAVAIESAAHAK